MYLFVYPAMKSQWAKSISTISILGLSGCASIVSKSDWPVTFNSSPSGSEIVIKDADGKEIHRGITPATITLHASKGYMQPATYEYVVTKDGYNPAKGSITAGVNGWLFGNILFGGLIGLLIVDPLTGAAYHLPPETSVNLIAKQNLSAEKGAITIMTLSDIPEELRVQLVRIN